MVNKKHKNSKKPFKWEHTLGELILWLVRWYCSHAISYRDLQEMPENTTLRAIKYLNNSMENDYKFTKSKSRYRQWYQLFFATVPIIVLLLKLYLLS